MKIGTVVDNVEVETSWRNEYKFIQYNDGTKCIVVSSSGSLSELVLNLGSIIEGNWYILYVMLVSHTNEVGRYQSIEIENFDGVKSLFNIYKNYFDNDGRHHIWLASTKSRDLIVYDNHNLLYLYGQIENFSKKLSELGYVLGDPQIPTPHTHHYNAEFTGFESRIMMEWNWKKFPLLDTDDQ